MTASSKKKLNNSNAAARHQQNQREHQQQHQQENREPQQQSSRVQRRQQRQQQQQQLQQQQQEQQQQQQQPQQQQQQQNQHQRQQRRQRQQRQQQQPLQQQQQQQQQQHNQQQHQQQDHQQHQQQEQVNHHQQSLNAGIANMEISNNYTEYTNNIQHLRCRVDVLDMSSQPDGEFTYILIYQDDSSKFTFLKPLRGKDAENVSNGLIDIFCQLGATLIVSAKCEEFAQQVTREMRKQWPGCFVVVGRSPSQSELLSYQRCAEGVKEALMKCMDEKRAERWSRGLRFVQWNLNSASEACSNRHASSGLLNERALLGVSTLLDCNIIQNLETEEGLVNALLSQKNQ